MPQYNLRTESALLGAILRNPKNYTMARDLVKHTDFHSIGNQRVWEIFEKLDERGMGIDAVTVGDELERGGYLQDVINPDNQFTGRAALSWARDNCDHRNTETYAAEVLDYSAKRQIELIFTQGVNWSQNGRRADEILNDVMRRIGEIKIYDQKVKSHTSTLADAVSLAYDHTDRASRGEITTISTGFKDIDFMLGGGLIPPDVMIIAGRPGDGKTALKTSIAKRVSEMGKKVTIFTLEMTNKQIAMRLLAMESGVTYGKQKSGMLEERDWALYTNAVDKLSHADYGITLNDLPAITITQMRRSMREIFAKQKQDLIIVDYIQLQGADGDHERRDLQIGEITRGIKSLAKEFEVPFIAGAQMSRSVETRADKKPMLSDLRESGSIENDADIVAFIHRPDKTKNEAELIFAKNRNGALGVVDLYYRGELTKFESATTEIKQFHNVKG